MPDAVRPLDVRWAQRMRGGLWVFAAAAVAAAATIWGADPPRATDPSQGRSVRLPHSGDAAAARVVRGPDTARRDGDRPDPDRRWRDRIEWIDQQARTALDPDDATARKLSGLQRWLRRRAQGVGGRAEGVWAPAGSDGLPREQVAGRVQQRIGGFRAQVVKLLGEQRAEAYLRIVDDARMASPPAHVAQD